MRRSFILLLLIFFGSMKLLSQSVTENIVIITFDGLRWQELFGGADSALINDVTFTEDSTALKEMFWAGTPQERRKKLAPFIWSTLAEQGQLYGNRLYHNYVNVKNPFRVSYPGYNEIFTGFPDSLISNNDKKENKNESVLEFLTKQNHLKGKVAAFASWDVFRYIFRKNRSGFLVNAGIEQLPVNSSRGVLLNEMQQAAFQPFGDGIRPDLLTYYLAKEYLLVQKPKVLYIGFDDTDDWAHNGKYDYYLQAAHRTDAYIADLWNTLQSLPDYKNKTTLVLLTDHGRGDEIKKEWTSHGKKIRGADQIWMAFLGKGIAARGEIQQPGQLYQAQVAQTIAQLLGYTFSSGHPIEKPLQLVTSQ